MATQAKFTCTNVVNGTVCGHEVVDGFCEKCGTIYDTTLMPVDPSAASDPGSPVTLGSKGGSLRSSRRSTRFEGVPAASAQGLSNKARLGRKSSQRSSTQRRNLGGGWVTVKEVPRADPMRLVTDKYDVPISERFCDDPTGHKHKGVRVLLDRKDKDGNYYDTGVCHRCGSPYSYPITAGTIIANQYEVKGTIAKGGRGYVYLARDLDVGRWAVIKEAINKVDPTKETKKKGSSKLNSARSDDNGDEPVDEVTAEKLMLARLANPSVVQIFGFKSHQGHDLIVMELVDGKTIDKIYEDNGGPLPVAQAIAYVLGMCLSIGFLHEQNPPVYNPDIKPDNFMQTLNRLVMIDAGGCILSTAKSMVVTSTVGFAPREVDDESVQLQLSPQSDIASLGRVLAVLSNSFDFEGVHRYGFPDNLPNFDTYPSYAALLKRCCAPDPKNRFESVAELEAQLWGVLREVVAIDTGATKPLPSDFFDGDLSNGSGAADWRLLPGLKVDQSDRARQEVETALKAATSADDLLMLLKALVAKEPKSREAGLRLANCVIDLGDYAKAQQLLDSLALDDPDDWRTVWYRGRLSLAAGDAASAVRWYTSVVVELPGEPAAKLALGLASELVGDYSTAIGCCDLVTLVEPDKYTMAAFIHSRSLLAEGDRASAVKALKRVPSSSIAHVSAEIQAARVLLQSHPSKPTLADLQAAAGIVSGVREDNQSWLRLAADLYLSAIDLIQSGKEKEDKQVQLMGVVFKERALRNAAREHLLACANHASGEEKGGLIAEALKAGPFNII